jgi:hypothetical protein
MLLAGAMGLVSFGLEASLHAVFAPGDLVRLTRNESLLFKGEHFLGAPKGQEFTVFKQERSRAPVFVAFIQPDSTVIAVTLPEEALERVPADAWGYLKKSVEAFRDQRMDEARRGLLAVSKEEGYRELAVRLLSQMDAASAAARPAFAAVTEAKAAMLSIEQRRRASGGSAEAEGQIRPLLELQSSRLAAVRKIFGEQMARLREAPVELERNGHPSLALSFDEGLDRLAQGILGNPRIEESAAGSGMGGSKVDRARLQARVNRAAFLWVRSRQAVGVKRMSEASGYLKEALEAEPAHPGLKALQAKVEESLKDAEDRYRAASANREGKNLQHGLLALERGLKICADYPKLLSLKKEMAGAIEAGASPPVSAEFLAAAKTEVAKERLEEGRTLYVTRCAECHDLEMLDSRSISGWKSMVSKMAGKAHLKSNQEELILQYLTAAKEASSR